MFKEKGFLKNQSARIVMHQHITDEQYVSSCQHTVSDAGKLQLVLIGLSGCNCTAKALELLYYHSRFETY